MERRRCALPIPEPPGELADAADDTDRLVREQCAKAFDDAFEVLNEDGTPSVLSLITALADVRAELQQRLGSGVPALLDHILDLLDEGDPIADDDLVCSWVDFISDAIRFRTAVAALYHLCVDIAARRHCLHPDRQPGGRLPRFSS